MKQEFREYLHTAVLAAQEAARIHRYYAGGELDITTKSDITDLVTQVDDLCEKRIREVIADRFPNHEVLGEELGGGRGGGTHRWIVDPLDGTVNYTHGFPFYCVSIGLEVNGRIEVGVVLDSNRGELYTAVRGHGAYLDGAPMLVSREQDPRRAMLATGFSYDPERKVENSHVFMRVQPQVRAIRRAGAAALDLCYVAAGRLDGFWEMTLNPWDVAAGILMIEEAGGRISAADGSEYRLDDPVLVASNGKLHDALIELLQLHEFHA